MLHMEYCPWSSGELLWHWELGRFLLGGGLGDICVLCPGKLLGVVLGDSLGWDWLPHPLGKSVSETPRVKLGKFLGNGAAGPVLVPVGLSGLSTAPLASATPGLAGHVPGGSQCWEGNFLCQKPGKIHSAVLAPLLKHLSAMAGNSLLRIRDP